MSLRRFGGILAALTLLLGVILLGFIPVTATLDTDTVDCGTAVAPNYPGSQRAVCEQARDSRNAWAVPLAVIGAVGLAGVAFVRRRPTTKRPAA